MIKSANSFFSGFLKHELVRNTTILISGTAVAQLIPILLQPLLRRYFAPEAFGAYSVYLSMMGILIVISSFRYELAIILPSKDKEAGGIFFLAVILNFLFSLLLFFAALIWKSPILRFLNLDEAYGSYLFFIPLGTFIFGSYQGINYWLIRKKKFLPLSVNKFVRRGFEGTAQIIFRIIKFPHGLIYGDLIGHVANLAYGIIQGVRNGLSFRFLSPVKIKYVLKKYAEYPKYNLVPAFMSACSYLLPAIMINKFYSAESTGFFDLSKLLLSVPPALIASSISNVLLQRVSEKNKSGASIRKDLLWILIFIILAVAFEIAVIMLWAEDIFRIFFGARWEISGSISKILVWAFAFNFFVQSFSSIFISLRKIRLLSFWQLFYFLSILSLFYFNFLSFNSFLKLYTLIEVICCTLITVFMISIVINYEQGLTRLKKMQV